MHQFFATLFALLLSFGHGHAAHRSISSAAFNSYERSPAMILPDRHTLARTYTDGVYAVSACVSCRRMDVSLSVR